MPRDGRTLKKTRKAVQTRLRARKWLARNGEPAKAYNRASAALSAAKRTMDQARELLTREKNTAKNADPRPRLGAE